MEHELERLSEDIEADEKSLKQLKEFQLTLNEIVGTQTNSHDLIDTFKELYSNSNGNPYSSIDIFDLESFNCGTLLLKLLCSQVSKEAKNVDFMKNPLYLFDTFASYREFLLKVLEDNVSTLAGDGGEGLFGYSRLQEKEVENGKKIVDAYISILFQNTLYHNLRQFVSVKWNPTTEPELAQFFEKWKNLIPSKMFVHMLIAYIEPKLKSELLKITSSNILDKLLHNWLADWVGIFEQISNEHDLELADSFKVTIRLKLIQLLKDWHPSNAALTQEIQKWRDVYDEKSWGSLISQSVVPKLAHNLKQLKINPQDQQIEPVSWILRWQSHLDTETLASMFAQNLLPKWLQTLSTWLESQNADLSEIMEWYQGWKSILPEKILQHEKVQKYLNGALVLINSKV